MQKSVSSFDSNQKPVDVRLINFKQARISHSISDVITLMMTSMGPKVRFRQIVRGRCFVPLHLLHFFCKIQHCPSRINIKHLIYKVESGFVCLCVQYRNPHCWTNPQQIWHGGLTLQGPGHWLCFGPRGGPPGSGGP